jgi:hypothetical protein
VQKPPGTGHEMRVDFCNCCCKAVCKAEINPVLTYFKNEGLVNPQNTSYNLADNPRIIHAVLFNDAQVGGVKCYQCNKNNLLNILFGHNKFRKVYISSFHAISLNFKQ